VETAGVEPASESPVLQTSTYLVCCSLLLSQAQQTRLLESQPDEISPLFLRQEQELSHHKRRTWLNLTGTTQSVRAALLGSQSIRIVVCVYIFSRRINEEPGPRYAIRNASTPVEASFRPHKSKLFDEPGLI
jgi:hypothetical protein